MDLRNLCSKLDMDAIRAKIPPLPNMMGHIKLPKSMSKLKSRKIFRSSRDDVNSVARHSSSKSIHRNETLPLPLGPPYNIPPSDFINRTPTRISTISSLMNQSGGGSTKKISRNEVGNSYCSAGGIDDYYPSPLNQRFEQRLSRPISPVKALTTSHESEQNIKKSFSERVQKGYKDVSSFRLKHIFAKKSVVRRDNIDVDQYVDRFNEERQRDERMQYRRDFDIAENYRFQFKVSKQNSDESYGSSPIGSPTKKEETSKKLPKSLSELSGDESGMESSPPKRKPGVAATRFSNVRSPPLSMSLEDDSDDDMNDSIELDEEIEISPKPKPNTSTLYEIRKQKSPETSHQSPQRIKNFKERMSRYGKDKSLAREDTKKVMEKKRRAPLSPQQSEEQETPSTPTQSEKPLDVLKQNLKRFQKSLRMPQQNVGQSGADSEIDDTNQESKVKLTKTQQIAERLRRFRSVENVNKNQDEENKVQESPMHRIAQKLVEWKNIVKKKPQEVQNAENDNEDEAANREKPVGSLMKKLKHIRSRKHASTDDPDEDEEGGETYKESLSARAKLQLEKGVVAASQVPQRTIKKISETKKYFRKKQVQGNKSTSDNTKWDDEEEDDNEVKKRPELSKKVPPPIIRTYYRDSSEEDEDDEDDVKEDYHKQTNIESNKITVTKARAAWTTKPILSDDTTDYDDELPRVLIHQDNSDSFESTLIIAVTRPRSHMNTPIITELPPDSPPEDLSLHDRKSGSWITEELTPPSESKNFKDSLSHSRKHSTDSSSDDSWIKDVPRDVSTAPVINSLSKNEAPWKIPSGKDDEKLYKTKSIDIFEFHNKNGGIFTAFEDFDDQLKSTPVVKIEESKMVEIHLNTASFERDSSEELDYPDDDNSSRVTKILVQNSQTIAEEPEYLEPELKSLPYGNSRESLMANLDEKEDIIASEEEEEDKEDSDDEDDYENDDDDDEDRPPSKAPSPPPTISLPPPPLPQRQPSLRLSKVSQLSLDDSCPTLPPPPLPLTKPPIPPNRPTVPPQPQIPNRTHISKPLVKTSSLRLAYSEQVNPQDVGKVNKLISRFETDDGLKTRPRIVPRKPYMTSESEEYSGNEDEEDDEGNVIDLIRQDNRDRTPTNQPKMQKSFSIDSADIPQNNNNTSTTEEIPTLSRKATSQIILDNSQSVRSIPSISISSSCQDFNSNLSQPNSEYGSPLTYPSSLVGSTEVTPLTSRREADFLMTRRGRRSLQRDDENFYSFDSDEENSYYSISSTGSSRYVVEL